MKSPRLNKTITMALSAGLLVIGSFLTGCGSKSSSSGGTTTSTYYPCTTGSNCVYSVNQNSLKGFYAQSTNFSTGYMNNGSSFTPTGSVTTILEEAMGVCNRGAYNGGLADCGSWVSGYYDLVFLVNQQNPNQVTLVFRSYPMINQNYWYSYNLPTLENFFLSLIGWPVAQNPQGTYNPLILTTTIYPVNNSQGFEIRGYGPQVSAGYNKLIQLQVANGKIEDQSFQFQLFWNGTQIGSGTMARCQSATCGL